MFDADRPITNSNQDRLNRSLFAKYLARCMLDHHDPESLVVGLYGGWGVGKTSVINLILEELSFAASNMDDQEKPIILNFSPWSYSGQRELIYSFFRRLSSTLRSVPYLENSDRIIHLLELYVSFFTHKPVPRAMQPKRTLWQKLTLQGREETFAWESGRDLTLVKAELNELLKRQKHKIIIIIDNISRLQNEEIKQIFQIVKSMGDYANTIYLLAFDKHQVANALNKIDGDHGEHLIEKVVQLPFDIPPILQQDLENIFSDRIQDVLKTVPQGTWNTEYWGDIYYSSMKYLFENCRDITRYVNTLNFSYPRLRDIVNPVDFFALTALEVFVPEVYYGIRDNKDLFTDLLDNVYILDSDQVSKDKLRCNEILSRCQRIPQDMLLDMLIKIFPRLARIYHPELPHYHSDTLARKNYRACSPDSFDVYFRLSIQSSQLTTSEFETVLSIAPDAVTFDQALTRLNQDDRILIFLDKLDSKVLHKIPTNDIPSVINALLDNGDLFPHGISGPLSLDTPMRIHRIIHTLLQRLPHSTERISVLSNAISQASKSLYITIHELKEQEREHRETEDHYLPAKYRDLTPDQLKSLQKLALTCINKWAEDGRLEEHPRILPILFAWKNWTDNGECFKYVKKITETDRGLVLFLSAALEKAVTQAMQDYKKDISWEKYLDNISAFIPVDSLIPHAKLLFEDEHFEKLREREQLSLLIFLDLVKASTNKVIRNTSS